MSGLPAYVFVVRHGNRLDAADKQWHLSSPTPYDPPLTYGGLLQARQVGSQIRSILEQAKVDSESRNHDPAEGKRRRRRFKVVIHTSPFLRCVQTSVGISSGLSLATSSDSIFGPSDIIYPSTSSTDSKHFKSTVLRLDSFLGEWLSPEYFENITPPPGSALMLAAAKADLLKREDYSRYIDSSPPPAAAPGPPVNRKHSLWSASPAASPSTRTSSPGSEYNTPFGPSSPPSEDRKGYSPPKPTYAVSSSGKIPDGFITHAKDSCVAVDYQWDSMRKPLDFGDGGLYGEEWTTMHMRFRKGVRAMLNWYATTESPAEMVTKNSKVPVEAPSTKPDDEEEDVETVVILVSHGAGCNALIGAITHQPVLMDVGIASITMAARKPHLDYHHLQEQTRVNDPSQTLVQVDAMYNIEMSASTEHLHHGNHNGTPISAGRSGSGSNTWTLNFPRGRTSTFGQGAAPAMSQVTLIDPFSAAGSRSSSANATVGNSYRRDMAPVRPLFATTQSPANANTGYKPASISQAASGPPAGLWTPSPSTLRLVDDGTTNDDDIEDLDDMLPDFDQKRFQRSTSDYVPKEKTISEELAPEEPERPSMLTTKSTPGLFSSDGPIRPVAAPPLPPVREALKSSQQPRNGPILAAPIRLQTDVIPQRTAEQVSVAQLGDGLGGLWSPPLGPGEAERFRDMSQSKRRWTVNERA